MKPFGGCEARLKPSRYYRSHQRVFFFTMETNYLEQIEEALINAAIEKQIELERRACEPDVEYRIAIENLLRYKRRKCWIKRGVELFGNNLPF